MRNRNNMIFSKYTVGVLIVLSGVLVATQGIAKLITNVPSDISGEELKAVVVEDFEKGTIAKDLNSDGWLLRSTPKKYTNSALSEKKLKRKNPVPELQIKFLEGSPNDMQVEKWSLTELGKTNKQCLGVKFRFRYPGFNSVHIMPPLEVTWKEKKPSLTYNPRNGKEEQERGIQLPGRAKAISLWVHGRGNPYTLEVWIKDYRGDTHALKLGSVNFVGWRPMKVEIPSNIPQSFESFPQTRVAKITKLVLRAVRSAPAEELINDTYFFFDQLKVLTDTYEVNFDGNDLHKSFESGKAPSGGGTK